MGGAAAAFDVGGFPHTSYPERKPSAFCVWLGWGAAELRVLLGESQAKLWRSLGAAGAVGPRAPEAEGSWEPHCSIPGSMCPPPLVLLGKSMPELSQPQGTEICTQGLC